MEGRIGPKEMRPRLIMRLVVPASVVPLLLLEATLASSLDSNALAQGESWSFDFVESGVYAYYCTPHPWMKGRVIVDAGAAPGNATLKVTIQGFGFEPAELLIPRGARVNWTNRDDTVHTVTQTETAPSNGIQRWQIVVGVVSLAGSAVLMSRLLRGPKPPE